MTRRRFECLPLPFLAVALLLGVPDAKATPFTVNSGVTDTSSKTLTGTETGSILAGGALAVTGTAITANNGTTNITIDNSGSITAGNRGIDTSGSSNTVRSITLNNNLGASISTSNDAFRVNLDLTGGTITVNNAGSMLSATGQALDFNSITAGTATVVINNAATGVIRADLADAIRPGNKATVNNRGQIIAFDTDSDPGNDGIDFQDYGGTVNNLDSGSISGARHGVTATTDIAVTNEKDATITGRNGSGVGSDGTGTVTNHGTITGAVDGTSPDGDGDGVDIDFAASITNYGTIQGTGAAGSKDGSANTSEGIAAGGGAITNKAGALISGAHNGILIDDSNNGGAGAATALINEGTIQGLNGFGVRIVGTQDDTVTNTGTIVASSGSAIDMGGGSDTLKLGTGSSITGLIDGGAGTDTVKLNGTGTLADITGFEILKAESGSWTLAGTQTYAVGVGIANGATLKGDGTTLIAPVTVDAGGTLSFSGAPSTVDGTLDNAGTIRVDNTTVTYTGTVTNSGAYISDPSTQNFTTLVTTETGYIQAAAGDVYSVTGDFLNYSVQAGVWDTRAATLVFAGASGTDHLMLLTGSDLGAVAAGMDGNFAWGIVSIEAGNRLILGTGLDDTTIDVALYVGEILGAQISNDSIANILGNGFNIYYDAMLSANEYLDGLTYALADGGFLIAYSAEVPEPAALALLLPGLALIGFATRRRPIARA